MDKLCNIIDREGKISCYQLQNILGFGDFVFYKIMNFVLSEYPEKYKKIKKDIQLKGIYETSTPVTDIEIPPQSKDWEMEL